MSQTSPILSLPLIQPSQAQKHVTHNEALVRLDRIVQLSVADRDQTTPPPGADIGARHIVAGAGSGAWAGQGDAIAIHEGGDVWAFETPRAGWQAWVEAEESLIVYSDTEGWQAQGAASELETLGVNTQADAVNRLAVASDATLLTHDGAGHQLKINKAVESDTASLLFQTGWSGRAEMGTAGAGDFSVKVSSDGSSWATGLQVDAASGRVAFPSGAAVPVSVPLTGRWQCQTDNAWAGFSAQYGTAPGNHFQDQGTGTDPDMLWVQMGIFVAAGTRLDQLVGSIRTNSTEVTGCDLQICLQYGLADGTLGGTADVTRDVLANVTNHTFSDTDFKPLTLDLAGYVAPQDGNLLVFIRPVGTLTATRYIYLSSLFRMVQSS